jgi:4-hydroxy-3-polyprenylbenzoate decarboxylase
MDSRTKQKGVNGFTREWPGKALSSLATIEAVDKKWASLGIGEFIPSPSLIFSKEIK